MKFLALGVLLLIIIRVLAQYRAVSSALKNLRARKVLPFSTWHHVAQQAEYLAYEHRLAAPSLYVLPEFSPNAMALRGSNASIHLVLTEGLLQVLTQEELDAVLMLLLAQASFRDCARAARVSWYLLPFGAILDLIPRIFWIFLSPLFALLVRFFLRPARLLRSDRRAVQWMKSPALANCLQKIVTLARKLPMRRWNLAYDHLFLISPIQLEATAFSYASTQPPIPQRLRRLLEMSLGT